MNFQNTTSTDCVCDSELEESFSFINVTLDFVCREANKVVLKVCNEKVEENVYFLEAQKSNEISWHYVARVNTNSSFLIADNLQENQKYKFRVWVISTNGTVYNPIETKYITTKGLKDRPLPIASLDLLRFEYDTDSSDYKAILTWSPSAGIYLQ